MAGHLVFSKVYSVQGVSLGTCRSHDWAIVFQMLHLNNNTEVILSVLGLRGLGTEYGGCLYSVQGSPWGLVGQGTGPLLCKCIYLNNNRGSISTFPSGEWAMHITWTDRS